MDNSEAPLIGGPKPCASGSDLHSEHVSYASNAVVEAEQHEAADRRPGDQSAGKMDRIESSNRLSRKGLPCSPDDFPRDAQDVPARGRSLKDSSAVRSFALRDLFESMCADKHPIALNHRQFRGENRFSASKSRLDFPAIWFTQQPGKDRAGFRIQLHLRPLSSFRRSRLLRRFSPRGRDG